MNKLYLILLSIIFTGNSLSILALRKPLKKSLQEPQAQIVPLSNEEAQDFKEVLIPIIEDIIEEKLKKSAIEHSQNYVNQSQQQLINFTEKEKTVINIIAAILQLEQEVHDKNKTDSTLAEAIKKNNDKYQINSKGASLNWNSIITGELFSLIWNRWQYKMHNNISITWQNMEEEYAITVITESSSENINIKTNPVHCDFTKKLRKTTNFETHTPRIKAIMTGKCYDYGCEKQVAIRCKKAILIQLLQEQKNKTYYKNKKSR